MDKKKLRIALGATLHKKVRQDSTGGTEVFVYLLGNELIKQGHQVTLFATGDSKIDFPLYPISKEEEINKVEQNQRLFYGYQLLESQIITNKQNDFDIIHINYFEPFLFAPFSKLISKPVVYTIHSDLLISSSWQSLIKEMTKPSDKFIFVSKNALNQAALLDNSLFIYNGIDTTKFPFSATHDNYLLWLGRVRKKKGIKEAVEVAIKSQEKLIISGVIDNLEEKTFFETEVKPLIDKNNNIKCIGPVDFPNKVKLYQKAKAFLFPVTWEEPFGLTMVEAMACGTPVIGFNRGAVNEVIVDNKTGFIVRNVDEMVIKTKKINKINRADCRNHVENNFSIEKMTDQYESLYFSLI